MRDLEDTTEPVRICGKRFGELAAAGSEFVGGFTTGVRWIDVVGGPGEKGRFAGFRWDGEGKECELGMVEDG